MSRVNVKFVALTDPRFGRLAKLLGLADGDHARGRMEHLWAACTQRGEYLVPKWLVVEKLGDAGPDALVAAELARWAGGRGDSDTRRMHICGAEELCMWLVAKQEQTAKAGKSRASKAQRALDGTFQQVAGEVVPAKSSAPAPAPAPSNKKEVPAPPDECLVLADSLRDLILEQQPTNSLAKKLWPPTRLKWGHEFDVAIRHDGRTASALHAAMRWVFHGQTGDARFVVQSAEALRKKFDAITFRMNQPVSRPTWQTRAEEIRDLPEL